MWAPRAQELCGIATATAAVAGYKPVTSVPKRHVQFAVMGCRLRFITVYMGVFVTVQQAVVRGQLDGIDFLFLSFCMFWGSTLVAGLAKQHLYLLSHLTCPEGMGVWQPAYNSEVNFGDNIFPGCLKVGHSTPTPSHQSQGL